MDQDHQTQNHSDGHDCTQMRHNSRLLPILFYGIARTGETERLRCLTMSLASWRASVSETSTLLIDSKLPTGVADITSSTIWGISLKPIRFSKNAATATSSAAFKAIVLAPPASAASYARRRQGNLLISGGEKSRCRRSMTGKRMSEGIRSGCPKA